MNSMRIILAVSTALLLIALTSRTAALPPDAPVPPKVGIDPKPQDPDRLKLPTRKELMALKLKNTQAILEGIALNDFDKIQTASKELVATSRAADFLNAYKGTEYQFHIQTFRRPAEAIAKKAKEKNIDGVMVAYNDLTLSCLKCHEAMRDKTFEIDFQRDDGLRKDR